jgi:hypothetical protein
MSRPDQISGKVPLYECMFGYVPSPLSVRTFLPNCVGHCQRRRCCGTAYSLLLLFDPYLVVERLLRV